VQAVKQAFHLLTSLTMSKSGKAGGGVVPSASITRPFLRPRPLS